MRDSGYYTTDLDLQHALMLHVSNTDFEHDPDPKTIEETTVDDPYQSDHGGKRGREKVTRYNSVIQKQG